MAAGAFERESQRSCGIVSLCFKDLEGSKGENANKGGEGAALVRCVLCFVDGFWFVILKFKRGATRMRGGPGRKQARFVNEIGVVN